MYRHAMKAFALLLLVAVACGGEKIAETRPTPQTATPPATATTPPPPPATPTATAPEAEAEKGVWSGEVRLDAHAGTATFNYVGKESGDFVPMRFRPDSEAGKKILATCADQDLCEFEGSVRFLDEPPPENASAVGEIVSVDTVRKLPPESR